MSDRGYYIGLAQQHIADNYPHIVYANPNPQTLESGTIMGSWAYSLPHRHRIITNRERELAVGVLPADVTRAWLNDCYKLPLRRRKSQLNRNYVLPIHALRGEYGDCAYIDIKSAYLSILSLGFDVEYIPNKYIAVDPVAIPVDISSNKFCYSIAVAMSTTKISTISIMGREQNIFSVKKFNIYSNPCLYALAGDVLNGVAAEALAVLGDRIKYANTDGFVVESKYSDYLLDIIASWGFVARVKLRGSTNIGGVGSWRIGERSTKRFDKNAHDFTCELMPKSERLWLKKRFSALMAGLSELIEAKNGGD